LAISKRFIDMMTGEIGVESERDKGSRFWFRVPFDKHSPVQAPETPVTKTIKPIVDPLEATLAVGKKVLVVEDNSVLGDLAVRQLEMLGLEAICCATGKEAIEKGSSGKFDLILMDVNLPDISGHDASRAIRENEKNAGSKPVLISAMTAGAMEGDREQALKSGMDDYLAKPVRLEQLRNTIEKWLSKTNKKDSPSKDFYR
jgi:CheY-like chemotaxis protein